MKVASSNVEIQSTGIQSEAFFSVKQSNIGHIFGILRNQLYSNKHLAIIREYCTNAFDAHVDAGISHRPIEISFPTAFKNTLTIRDFGFGLTESQVYDIFVSYGESTKRGTNSQVGMLGLGSKSAFCYVNDFKITSYNGGKKSVYLAYIDETNIGKISKVHEEPSNETGLAIDIVVKTIDLQSFRDVAGQFLSEFNPKPIVLNDDRVVERMHKEVNENYIIQTDTYSVKYNYIPHSVVRMGNVNYPFTINDLQLDPQDANDLRRFNHLSVVLRAPIGSVVPSASRESLEFNSQTKDYIKNALIDIVKTISSEYQSKLDKCKSFYEFGLEFQKLNSLRDALSLRSTFNGKFYNASDICFLSKNYPQIRRVDVINDDARTTFKPVNSIAFSAGQVFFVEYGNVTKNSIRSRVLNSHYSKKKAYLLTFKDKTDYDSLKSNQDWEGASFVDVSSLQYVKSKGTGAGKFEVSEVYKYRSNQNTLRYTWQSVPMSLQDSEGVYVEIKRFQPLMNLPNQEILNVNDMQILLDHLHRIGISVDNLYGVKYCDIDKLGAGWVELSDYIQQSIYNMTDEQIEEANRALITFSISEEWQSAFNMGMIDLDPDLKRLKEIIENYYCRFRRSLVSGQSLSILKTHYGLNFYLDLYDECESLIEKTLNKHPMLKCVLGYTSSHRSHYWDIINKYLRNNDYLHCEGLLD